MIKVRIFICTLLLISFQECFPQYYVSPTGDDSQDGSQAHPFKTIGKALSQTGVTSVTVLPGTFTQDLTIPGGVTLRGTKAGIPAGPIINPERGGSNETIINGKIISTNTADNITIDGFKIVTDQTAITLKGHNHKVINNIIEGTTPNSLTKIGIATGSPLNSRTCSYTFRNNFITGFRYGIHVDGNIGDQESHFNENLVSICRTGIFISASFSNGHTIIGNTVFDCTENGIHLTQGGHVISNNTIHNNLTGIKVDNQVARMNSLTIEGNFIESNLNGILFAGSSAGFGNDNIIVFNSFEAITFPQTISNTISGVMINAECNKFSVTTNQFPISSSIDIIPMLTTEDEDLNQYGFQSSISSCLGPQLTVSISSLNNVTGCHGDSNGSFDLVITGGSLPYTVSWESTNGIEGSCVNSNGTCTAANLRAGEYSITVTDANGSQHTALTTTITEPRKIIRPEFITVCENQLPYRWRGADRVSAGRYVETSLNTSGCNVEHLLILIVSSCFQPNPGKLKDQFSIRPCIDRGSLLCYHPVDKICRLISGVCGGCAGQCTDMTLGFTNDQLTNVILIANDQQTNTSRVISKAVRRGKEFLLNNPLSFKLRKNENLSIQFIKRVASDKTIQVNVYSSK